MTVFLRTLIALATVLWGTVFTVLYAAILGHHFSCNQGASTFVVGFLAFFVTIVIALARSER